MEKCEGKVYLVGAGVGADGLITERGAQLLSQAQAVVYDRLLDFALLLRAPLEAEFYYVGKNGIANEESSGFSQEEINDLLLRLAGEGRRVVRLHGGDPLLFGRGGEELDILASAGVSYEVVPGVSSALALGALTSLSLTQRSVSSAVHIYAASRAHGEELPFDQIASAAGTSIFLMGSQRFTQIVQGLLAAGAKPELPLLVAENLGYSDQRFSRALLKNAASEIKGVSSPALIAIGEVLSLEKTLTAHKPCSSQRALFVGTARGGASLAQNIDFSSQTLEVLKVALLPVKLTLEQEKAPIWLFSSVSSVDSALRSLPFSLIHSKALGAVGKSTARHMEERGLPVSFVPDVYSMTSLVQTAAESCKGSMTVFTSSSSRNDFSALEKRCGRSLFVVVSYKTEQARLPLPMASQVLSAFPVIVVMSTLAAQAIKQAAHSAKRPRYITFSSSGKEVLEDAGDLKVEALASPSGACLSSRLNELFRES